MSVSSTATITGDVYLNGGTRRIVGDAALELYSGGSSNLNLRTTSGGKVTTSTLGVAIVGSVSASSSTNVLGLATVNTQSTVTLTTPASSGTLANLGDAVFPVTLQSYGGNPADGSTYYFGNAIAGLVNNSAFGNVKLPYNCTLVAWDLNWYGSPGTAESSTLSVSGTTNYTLTSVAIFSAAAAVGSYTANGLSQSFSANDVLNIKWVTPTWSTNPTALYLGVTLWFVRRQ
jgi:hypothetical protein